MNIVVVASKDINFNGHYSLVVKGLDWNGNTIFSEGIADAVFPGEGKGGGISHGCANVEVASNGDFVVTWLKDKVLREHYWIMARYYWANGQPKTDPIEIQSVPRVWYEITRPDVAIDDEGNFVVVWADDKDGNGYYQAYAQGFNSSGMEIFPRTTIHTVDKGNQWYPSVAAVHDGRFVVTWTDDRDMNGVYQVMARGFNMGGKQILPERTVNSEWIGDQQFACIDFGEGLALRKHPISPLLAWEAVERFVVAWMDNRNERNDIYARSFRFDEDSIETLHDRCVNDPNSTNYWDPSIAVDSNGNFVVVYTGDPDHDGYSDVYARGLTASGGGKFANGQIKVNSVSAGFQYSPKVAINDSDGKFAVVWEDKEFATLDYQDTPSRILIRIFDENGIEHVHDTVIFDYESNDPAIGTQPFRVKPKWDIEKIQKIDPSLMAYLGQKKRGWIRGS